MKLSIIIPVYNVEQYLDACLQSILKQGLEDYEVILVDDCSPDKSGAMCDDWSNQHKEFRVLHSKVNGGLSEARNIGLRHASGEYVTFVDSDDYLANNTLRDNVFLLERNPDVDILEYPVYVLYGGKRAFKFIPANETISFPEWISSKGYMCSYAYNKIYKRSLWNRHCFPKGKNMEDLFTIPYVIKESGRIMRTDAGMYYYCDRKGSISNTISLKNAEDFLEANLKLYDELKDVSVISEYVKDELYLRLCNAQIVVLQLDGKMSIPNRCIPFRRCAVNKLPMNLYLKCLLKSIIGKNYCKVLAAVRNLTDKLN